MKVTFKYVGQGDSVVIEWKRGPDKCVGIVDSNQYGSVNSVVQHLRSEEYSEIEFVFLSHPHTDHYSGLLPLLEYCDSNSITIRNFYHTVIDPERIVRSIYSVEDRDRLEETLAYMNDLYVKDVIDSVGEVEAAYPRIPMNREFDVSVLSPSNDERNRFYKRHFSESMERKATEDMNLLSTVLLFESSKYYFLLTSDATKETFIRLVEKNLHKKSGKKLLFIQVAHHGSENNFVEDFWLSHSDLPLTGAVVSVGPNNYGHPNKSVVESILSLGYDVAITGNEAELLDYSNHSSSVKSSALRQGPFIHSETRRNGSDIQIFVDIAEELIE